MKLNGNPGVTRKRLDPAVKAKSYPKALRAPVEDAPKDIMVVTDFTAAPEPKVGLGKLVGGLFKSLTSAIGRLIGGPAGAAVEASQHDHGEARAFTFKPKPFAQAYQKQVQAELKEHGVDWKPKVEKFSISKKSREAVAAKMITQAAVVASQHLGPAMALAIGGAIGQAGQPDAEGRKALDAEYLGKDIETVSTEKADGVSVHRVSGLEDVIGSVGGALTSGVYLDVNSESSLQTGTPLGDFVIGHELSHIKHDDEADYRGQKMVADTVYDVAVAQNDTKLGPVAEDLEKALYENLHEIELRSDKEGFDYAVSQGHEAETTRMAAATFFGAEDWDDTYSSHPNPRTRNEALGEQADEISKKKA